MGISQVWNERIAPLFKPGESVRKLHAEMELLKQQVKLEPRGVMTQYVAKNTFGEDRAYGLIPYNYIKSAYEKTSCFRACVDRLRQIISTQEWDVVGKSETFDQSHATVMKEFLDNPNFNNESFQQLISKCMLDLLLYDASVIEKVRNMNKQVIELYNRDGSTFKPVGDKHGVVNGYVQWAASQKVEFAPQDVVYIMQYPQTDSFYGMPIFESIVNESSALLNSVSFIADSFSKDEIPPGILMLGGIGEVAYLRLLEQFKQDRGKLHHRIKLLANQNGFKDSKWIEFSRTNRDMQLVDIIKALDLIIYRAFCMSPSNMGVLELNRATAEAQDELTFRQLIIPMSKLWEYFINTQIVWPDFFPDIKFRFIVRQPRYGAEYATAARTFIQSGIKTINEVREDELGMEPLKGGDDAFMLIGNEMFSIEEGTAKPQQLTDAQGEKPVGSVPADKKPATTTPPPTATPPPPQITEKKADSVHVEKRKFAIKGIKKITPRKIDPKDVKGLNVKDIEKTKIAYYDELSKFWNIFKEKVAKDMKRSFRIEKMFKTSNIAQKETRAKIAEEVSKLKSKWSETAYKYFNESVEIGINGAVKLAGKERLTTEKEVKTLVTDLVQENEKYLEEGLLADVESNLNQVGMYDYENETDLNDSILNAIEVEEFRVANYSSRTWGAAQQAMADELLAQGYTSVSWVTHSNNSCPDCEALEANSPYDTVEDMGAIPGDGSTECKSSCWCTLSYELPEGGEEEE